MKHIKTYSVFEASISRSDKVTITNYLHDIFQELTDVKFLVDIYITNYGSEFKVDIYYKSSVNMSYFKFGAVKEYTLSAIDYMKSIDWLLNKYECNAKNDDDETTKVSLTFGNKLYKY